jgi:hypothetical protein
MKKMKINLSPDDYYTQRNNKWDDPITPFHESTVACKNTTRVMFYKGNKIPFASDPTEKWADDDYFMDLLRGQKAREWAKNNFNDWRASYKELNEVNEMYPLWLDVQVCGKIVSEFRENCSYEEMIAYLDNDKVIATSGIMPCIMKTGIIGKIHHAFLIMGYTNSGNLLIADPWGDYKTMYTSQKGYNVEMSKDDFFKLVKNVNTPYKWAHLPLV